MAKGKRKSSEESVRPPLSPENREIYMSSLAMDLAEQQLRDGTASSQVITHYLKLGSMRHKEEMEKLRRENELLRAKTESINSSKRSEEMMEKAIAAFKGYQGIGIEDDQDIF